MDLYYGWFMAALGSNDPSGRYLLGHTPIETLGKNIPVNIKSSEYYKCPAFTDEIRKILVVKAGYDFDFELDQKTGAWHGSNPEWISKYVHLNNLEHHGLIQFTTDVVMFSPKSVKITVMHPFMHHNDLTNVGSGIQGTYDIGKWFRPLQAAYYMKPNQPKLKFSVRQGDPLFYVKVDTDEPIKIHQFHETQAMREILLSCLQLKQTRHKIFTLQEAYARFKMHNFRKKIMKEIKEQYE